MNPDACSQSQNKVAEAFLREMMSMYERLDKLPPKLFKRKCGIRRETFEAMVSELRPDLERKGKRGGQCKFGVEDQLLIALEYWREYRTQFHIGQSWGIHETTVGRTVPHIPLVGEE